MKKIILAGGGDPPDSQEVDAFFKALLRHKNFLFFPQAISPEVWTYEKSYCWIKESKTFSDIQIEIATDLGKISLEVLIKFDAIYLMGGNTFTLMKKFREHNLDKVLLDYLDVGGVIYGLSAGAIILGANIKPAEYGPEKDENEIGLTNLNGLNLLNDALVFTHYNDLIESEILELSQKEKRKIICIPETSGIYIDDNKCKVIGRDPITLVEYSRIKKMTYKETFIL